MLCRARIQFTVVLTWSQPFPVVKGVMEAFFVGPIMAIVFVAHVVEEASRHADDKLTITLAHGSHPVEVV